LASGDALVTTLEFKLPGSFTPITDMTGDSPFKLKPGQWTDDTFMALSLAESLIECLGFDLADHEALCPLVVGRLLEQHVNVL
jgi:ADP-ribosyl-[dinitrogen reductase] hydrolase